jgi:hypothetical protein
LLHFRAEKNNNNKKHTSYKHTKANRNRNDSSQHSKNLQKPQWQTQQNIIMSKQAKHYSTLQHKEKKNRQQ